jgi:hypothetical protein
VQRACTFLKPDGVFLCQEYLRWETFRLVPDSPEVRKIIEASLESWQAMDGEIDIAPALPAMFRRNGLQVAHSAPIAKVSKPNQMIWQWLANFLKIYSLKLIDTGLLTTAARDAFLKVWPRVEAHPDSMLIAPLMMEVIAKKA